MLRQLSFLAASLILLAGCLGDSEPATTDNVSRDGGPDLPMVAVQDAYYDVVPGGETTLQRNVENVAASALGGDVRFHTYEEMTAKLEAWNATYPDLVELDAIGESHQGRPVWRVVVTDESLPSEGKVAPLLDGGHHGNEYGGSEIMTYAVDLLLENHATNATVRQLLRDLEIHVIPVVNPDGYAAGTRHNGFGVNLNRNYDVDWGNPAGTSNPVMGAVGAATGMAFSGLALVAENCGASAFSEPESQAVAAVMEELGGRAAFYLSGHTPTHAVIAPPAAFDPPFDVPADHRAVLDEELQWIRDHTEYEAGRAQWGDLSAGLPYAASGSSMDYFYHTVGKPAFTVEVEYFPTAVTAEDYPFRLAQEFEGLRYWMDATVPLPMHLLANAVALHAWEAPTAPALLPPDHVAPALPERPHQEWPYLH
ncbi:MAG: M14 family metallopeptidase [Thermoplasmatota archaeon]